MFVRSFTCPSGRVCIEAALSVDCAFKGTDTSDFVAIQVWATVGPNFYLVDQQLERLDFVETCRAILAWTERYPMATKKLVEDKANGPAVLSVLRQRINGLQLPVASMQTRPEGHVNTAVAPATCRTIGPLQCRRAPKGT